MNRSLVLRFVSFAFAAMSLFACGDPDDEYWADPRAHTLHVGESITLGTYTYSGRDVVATPSTWVVEPGAEPPAREDDFSGEDEEMELRARVSRELIEEAVNRLPPWFWERYEMPGGERFVTLRPLGQSPPWLRPPESGIDDLGVVSYGLMRRDLLALGHAREAHNEKGACVSKMTEPEKRQADADTLMRSESSAEAYRCMKFAVMRKSAWPTWRIEAGTSPLSGCVYFIHDGTLTKVGYTRRAASERMRQLQTGSGRNLVLIGFLPGGRATEKLLHQRFAERRQYGEWFDLDREEAEQCILAHGGSLWRPR